LRDFGGLRFQADIDIINQLNVITFAGLFSGTPIAAPRSWSDRSHVSPTPRGTPPARPIIEIMQARRLRLLFGWLAIAAVCCFAAAQTAALTPGHSENHTTHCCQCCHLGHSVAAQDARVFVFAWALTGHARRPLAAEVDVHNEISASAIPTRGPPRLSLS
jgi:hypothetical protein